MRTPEQRAALLTRCARLQARSAGLAGRVARLQAEGIALRALLLPATRAGAATAACSRGLPLEGRVRRLAERVRVLRRDLVTFRADVAEVAQHARGGSGSGQ